MAEINEHTINALILRFNLKDSPDLRSALADAYRSGYAVGYAVGYGHKLADLVLDEM